MKSNDFTVSPDKTTPRYEIKNTVRRKNSSKKNLLAVAIITAGLLLMQGGNINGQSKPKMGKVAYNPEFYTIEEFQAIAQPIFESYFVQKITKDVPLTIKTKKGDVTFTAELYNKDKKIAVEWLNYNPSGINATNLACFDKNEISMVSNYHCGDETVILIKGMDYLNVKQEFDKYIQWYKKEYSVK